MTFPLKSYQSKNIVSALSKWYRKQGRHDMPWRKTKDPYAILVSEFMLQQTTVATVRPYYDRFLKRFPTLSSLARAELNEVLALWSGLGYYARARNLWASAKQIQGGHRGKVPRDVETLLKLSGVGFYTAGAITALAYNRPAVVLDGNIIRVLMRLLSIEEDPKLKAVQVVLRKFMMELMDKKHKAQPKHLVLALMDLGATVCLPQKPTCLICPLSHLCLAKKNGYQDSIPVKQGKLDRPTVRRLYALIQRKSQWLIAQRPKNGLFGGLWEFPGFDAPAGVNPVDFLEECIKDEIGLSIRVEEALPAFEHQLSHRIMINRSFVAVVRPNKGSVKIPKKTENYTQFRWVVLSTLGRYGISAITKKIMNNLTIKRD